MIHFELNPESVDWQTASTMFDLVEWDSRTPAEVEASFKQSSVVYIAKDGEELIAFGRTVDDQKYYALIVDVVVHPKYQGQGIGKKIVDGISENLIGYNFITLTAAPNKEGFYERIGWKKQRTAFLLPQDEKQQKEHCE